MPTATSRISQDVAAPLLAAAENLEHSAKVILKRFRDYPDTEFDHGSVRDLEHRGDTLTRDIVQILRVGKKTSNDKEDLHFLVSAMDDSVDAMEHASEMLDLYRIEAPMAQAIDQCEILVRIGERLHEAVRQLLDGDDVSDAVHAISDLEDDGDSALRRATASLFEHEGTNPRTIIQWKDIFEALEEAMDSCNVAGMRVSNMQMRNA